MALSNFKEVFSNSYQEIFQKVLVGKAIANFRFQSGLKHGESVTRIKADISGVRVRDITIGQDRTIDSVTDSEELLTINHYKGTSFALSTKEMIQAGPLNPASFIGGKLAIETAIAVDADILYEAVNAHADFDNGDLTTLVSDGTPITLNSTTVPQMNTRLGSKLGKNNQTLTNLCMAIDHYGAGDIAQYMLGKDWDVSQSTFMNGYVGGNFASAKVYVTENLTGEAVLGLATQPTANDTVVINGLTFTFVASPSAEGDIDLGANVDETRAHLAAALNQGSGAGTDYIAFTGDDLETLDGLNVTATNDDTANTLTVVCKGSGRLTVSETLTDGTDAWDKNFIHAYFGKMGAIDVVMQEEVDMEKRDEPKQRASNIFSDALYGVKTFSDGSQKFLDVMIAA